MSQPREQLAYRNSACSQRLFKPGKYVAIDCEMVGVDIEGNEFERFLEGGKSARRLSRETQSSCADNGLY